MDHLKEGEKKKKEKKSWLQKKKKTYREFEKMQGGRIAYINRMLEENSHDAL